MSIQKIKELLELHSDDELVSHSMVCQLWSDGEVTLQKGGELFNCRSLHCIAPAVLKANNTVCKDLFPHQASNGFTYAFITNTEEAGKIRELMRVL